MYRQNRWITRISFVLVLFFATLGVWYGSTFWLPAIDLGDWSAYSEGIDWVETVSGWGEGAIQLLLQVTSQR